MCPSRRFERHAEQLMKSGEAQCRRSRGANERSRAVGSGSGIWELTPSIAHTAMNDAFTSLVPRSDQRHGDVSRRHTRSLSSVARRSPGMFRTRRLPVSAGHCRPHNRYHWHNPYHCYDRNPERWSSMRHNPSTCRPFGRVNDCATLRKHTGCSGCNDSKDYPAALRSVQILKQSRFDLESGRGIGVGVQALACSGTASRLEY